MTVHSLTACLPGGARMTALLAGAGLPGGARVTTPPLAGCGCARREVPA
jgi:hypothetical protein